MRRAVLIFNPNAGRNRGQRTQTVSAIAESLRSRDIDASILPTEGPGTASAQAMEAANAGADIVFACGGDGTLHEVLQGLVHHPHAALGVIPLGTANALARHIKLSMNPQQAALDQLACTPVNVPAGRITYQHRGMETSRYFTVLAGAGPDGTLIYGMLVGGKQRFGRIAYYLHALRLFATTPHRAFDVTTIDATRTHKSYRATAAMASRVADLGGLFTPLAGGADLIDPQLRLTLIEPPGFLSLPTWFALGWLRLHRRNPYLHTLAVESFTCSHIGDHPLHVEADGEYLGHTPMTVQLVPDALRILLPPRKP